VTTHEFYATLKQFDHISWVLHRQRMYSGISDKRKASISEAIDMLAAMRQDFYERNKDAHFNRPAPETVTQP
jgi:hypothetical protein